MTALTVLRPNDFVTLFDFRRVVIVAIDADLGLADVYDEQDFFVVPLSSILHLIYNLDEIEVNCGENAVFELEIDELSPEFAKVQRSRRLHFNAKFRRRDRTHGKLKRMPFHAWLRRIERDYTFGRVHAPTALPFGVAYEPRPRRDF